MPTISERSVARLVALGWLLGVLAVTAGCSSEERVKVYPVRGQLVTTDGKPAVGATVSFHPAGDSSTYPFVPHGKVSRDGAFVLTSYEAGDGAPAGEYAVTVVWRTENPEGDPGGPDRLKGRYANPARPLTRVTVREGDNSLEPFRIK
jgi:hypothetical protein